MRPETPCTGLPPVPEPILAATLTQLGHAATVATAPAEAVVDLTAGFDLVVTGQHNGSEAFTVKAVLVDIVRAP